MWLFSTIFLMLHHALPKRFHLSPMQYLVTVVAEDGGGRAGTGTVTIIVDDDNDMAPVFKKKIFRKTMSEGEPSGEVVVL